MLSCLLLLAVKESNEDAPVTLTLRAARLENAIPALAEATSIDLEVDEEIEDLVVVLKVRDRPAKSVLRFLAEQVNARWVEQDDGSLLLRRFPEDVKLMQVRQRALERQGLTALQAKLRKEVGDGAFTVEDVEKFVAEVERVSRPLTDGGGMSLDGPRLAAPASLLSKQLLLTIDPDDMLEIEGFDRIVVSDFPNGLQKKANAETLAAIDQFWKNVELFVQYKSALLGDRRGSGIDQNVLELEMPQSGRGKTIARVSRMNSSLSASVAVYGGDGTQFTSGFNLSTSILPSYKIPARLTNLAELKHPLSEESRLVQKLVQGKYWLDKEIEEEGEEARLLELLLEPENRDPLSFAVTDALFAWADALDLDLVAHLPALFERYVDMFEWKEELALDQLWYAMLRMRSLRVDEHDGVMTVHLAADCHSYLDRGYAKRLGELRRGLLDFSSRFDAAAKFFAETWEETGEASFGQQEMMRWTGAGIGPRNWDQNGMYAFPFWHYLPKSARDNLATGSWIDLGSLPLGIRRYLNESIGTWQWQSDDYPYTHQAMDPTEHFPNGLPGNTRIDVAITTDVLVTTVKNTKFRDGEIRTMLRQERLSEVARMLADPDQKYRYWPPLNAIKEADSAYTVTIQVIKLTFVAADGTSASFTLVRPLERSTPTDLGPEELVEKFLNDGR